MTITAQYNGEYGSGQDMVFRSCESRESENADNENLDDSNNVSFETTTSAPSNKNSKIVRSQRERPTQRRRWIPPTP